MEIIEGDSVSNTPNETFISKEALEAWGVDFKSSEMRRELKREELRDRMAMAALPECLRYWRTLSPAMSSEISYAVLAYDAADAMLKVRGETA